ncbi:MAG: alpha/beta hydrolase [Rickettsia sp.]|nr:alpha/beta hydrolase [Rickettsia sp.]
MTEIFLKGSAGRIHSHYAENLDNNSKIALVLHPHPQYGGSMNNKITYNVYKTLYSSGFNVLRINFRGVGKSEGVFDKGIGELKDAANALDWLQNKNASSKSILISGFSFGAWIASQLIMRRPEVTDFISVSPPVNKYDFSFFLQCPIKGLVLQGDMDSVVEERPVAQLIESINDSKGNLIRYQIIEGGDHFFRNKIDQMNSYLEEYLASYK